MTAATRALLIDMDGVLYQGDQAIPGARETVEWLASNKIPHLFVTNTTSRPGSALTEKLRQLNMEVDTAKILTPLIAATRWLVAHVDGPVALFIPQATKAEFNLETAVEREKDR